MKLSLGAVPCTRVFGSDDPAALGGRPVRQEKAQGILVAALGMLAAHVGYGEARRAS